MPEQPNNRYRYTIQGLMVVVVCAALVFAWVDWASRPTPFPVSGTVSFGGQPLASGKIVFAPSTSTGVQATGQLVAGKYSLTTFAAGDGAIPGTYSVAIVAPGIPARYQSPTTSGLSAQIQKSANMIDLDLR